MWNGHIVPVIDNHILLPADIRHDLGFVVGTRLIASAYTLNQNSKDYHLNEHQEIFGGILFSLTRKRALDRTTRFTFLLKNRIGAIREVTRILGKCNGQVVRMEGLASGHVTCQVVFPTKEDLLEAARKLRPSGASVVSNLSITPPPIADHDLLEDLEQLAREPEVSIHHETAWMRSVLLDAYKLEARAKELSTTSYGAVTSVRVTEDGIPLPEELYRLLELSHEHDGPFVRRQIHRTDALTNLRRCPEHVVVSSAPGSLALNCLIPNRPLFEISVRSHTYAPRDAHPGTGIIAAVSQVLEDSKIGIVHMQIENKECRYEEHPSKKLTRLSEEEPKKNRARRLQERSDLLMHDYDALSLTPRYEDGLLRFIAATPVHWIGLGPEQIEQEMQTLTLAIQSISLHDKTSDRELGAKVRFLADLIDALESKAISIGLAQSRVTSHTLDLRTKLIDAINALSGSAEGRADAMTMERHRARVLGALVHTAVEFQTIQTLYEKPTLPDEPDDSSERRDLIVSLMNTSEWRLLRANIATEKLDDFLAISLSKHSMPLQEVDIHGPPLLRCFFAHSDQPDDEERQLVIQMKQMLERLSFHVIEGKWTYGKAIDDTTRRQISRAEVLVSLLWPRTRRNENPLIEEQLASEWVIHEESYAMGAGVGIFRFREESVREPRYRRDFREYVVDRNDPNTWATRLTECREQLKRYVISRVLARDE